MSADLHARKLLALVALSALCVLATGWAATTGLLETLELKTLDYRFRLLPLQDQASADIVIAEIDDASIKHLEPVFGRWPWSRDVHAVFLRFMRAAEARLVVYDVLFTEADVGKPEGDREFAAEAGRSGNVLFAAALGDQVTGGSSHVLTRHSIALPESLEGLISFPQLDLPIEGLLESARSIGHANFALDADGPFRHYLLLAGYQDRALPSLSLAAAMASRELSPGDLVVGDRLVEAGEVRAPLNADQRLPIWFNGGPGTYRTYSYSQLVYSQLQREAGQEPGIEPQRFANKIVLVGLTATGLHETFTTPFAGSASDAAETDSGVRLGKMAGVEVHAHVLDNLLSNRYLHRTGTLTGWLIVTGMTLGSLAVIFYLPLAAASGGVAVGLGSYLGLAQLLFSGRTQLPVAQPVLAWTLAVGFGFAYQYWVEGAEKRRVKGIFGSYVSPDIFRELMHNPGAAELGGRRRLMTVLFSDLRGFTTFSENRPPEQVVEQLNEYFSAMVQIVFQHQGTVDKFVGDMVMALFGAPLDDTGHADHAVQCAVAMQKRLIELNEAWVEQGKPQLACGVGINTGDMIAGNVGSEQIRSYTVIGDSVNLGARLESLCKEYGASIIISRFTKDALAGDYGLKELGEVVVKGKSEPVDIFEVQFRQEGSCQNES